MKTLRLARALAGMNQTKFSERLGMDQQRFSEIESGRAPIPPEALVSVLAVLRSLPKHTAEQQALDFARDLDDLRREAELINALVDEIVPRMGSGDTAQVWTLVCRTLLERQAAILEAVQTRVAALPGNAN
jgi:transcriptional regulator with XRE-family HTH domain